MTTESIAIRPAAPTDVAAIVSVHLESFPGFFLTFLGPRFLNVLYRTTLQQPDAIGFVAVAKPACVIGFVIGVTLQASLYRRLISQHLIAFAWASLGAVLRSPTILPRLLRAFGRSAEATEQASDCLLMSIAVHPSAQGQYAGADLVHSFLTEARQRGARAVSLTTDRNGNDRVNHFYQSLGFTLDRTFVTAEGRAMNEYIIDLTGRVPGREEE